jgi:cell wall-associated NlpC family hydrolase
MTHKSLYIILFLMIHGCATVAPDRSGTLRTTPAEQPAERTEALLQALNAVGVSYRNGGNSHADGFDCSGLVAHVYREAWGISLPRTARGQSEYGVAVARAELQPGDLVFYNTLNSPYSHVGIYLGEGKFVHAPKPGAEVRIDRMNSSYWSSRFNGARRIRPES